jgi:hypothetical protein
VVRGLVVAEAAGEPLFAALGHEFAVHFVMFTAENTDIAGVCDMMEGLVKVCSLNANLGAILFIQVVETLGNGTLQRSPAKVPLRVSKA